MSCKLILDSLRNSPHLIAVQFHTMRAVRHTVKYAPQASQTTHLGYVHLKPRPQESIIQQTLRISLVPFCIGVFGFVTILQGFTHNFSGLVTARFFLGLAEASVFPSCNYILAMWYKRAEAQKRYTFVISGVLIAGAFGGLASAVGKLDGIRGYRDWRWMFIVGKLVAFAAGWKRREETDLRKRRGGFHCGRLLHPHLRAS